MAARTISDPVAPLLQRAPATAARPKALRQGSRGEPVGYLQRALNALELGPLSVDGMFGPKTGTAVTAFQSQSGLAADAIAGNKTKTALVGNLDEVQVLKPALGPAIEALQSALLEIQAQPEDSQVPPESAHVPISLDVPPFVLDGPQAVPETAAGPCPPYSAAERARSQQSGGGRLDFGDPTLPSGSALLFDFEPGSATVREVHHSFLRLLVDRFNLKDPAKASEKIFDIEGYTDCVGFAAGPGASPAINQSIRAQRAIAIKMALLDAGATGANVPATPHGGGEKGGPGDERADLVNGRALNRSVRISLMQKNRPIPELPGPVDPGPGPGLCDGGGVQSRHWTLTGHVSGSVDAIIVGVGANIFTLTDSDSGKKYFAVLSGVSGGLGTPVEIAINDPTSSPTPFDTKEPLCPGDFDGMAFIVTKISAGTPFTPGYSVADLVLGVDTIPVAIDIGGLQYSAGASTGIFEGWFEVIESLPR